MKPEELENKSFDVLTSQLNLSIDSNAYLKTILDILIETNQLNREDIMDKLDQNKEESLDLLRILDKD